MAHDTEKKGVCVPSTNVDTVTRSLQNRVADINRKFAVSKQALADWHSGENRRLDEIEANLRNQDEAIDITEVDGGDVPVLPASSDARIEELMRKADSLIAASVLKSE